MQIQPQQFSPARLFPLPAPLQLPEFPRLFLLPHTPLLYPPAGSGRRNLHNKSYLLIIKLSKVSLELSYLSLEVLKLSKLLVISGSYFIYLLFCYLGISSDKLSALFLMLITILSHSEALCSAESYLLCFGRLDHIVSLSFGLSKYLI